MAYQPGYKTQKLVVDGVNKFEYFGRSSWGDHSFIINAISAYFFVERGYERYESIMKKLKRRRQLLTLTIPPFVGEHNFS